MAASCPSRPPKKKRKEVESSRAARETLAVQAVFSSAAAVNRTTLKALSQWGKKNSLVIPNRLLAVVYLNTLSRISEACQVRPSGTNETTQSCSEGFFMHEFPNS